MTPDMQATIMDTIRATSKEMTRREREKRAEARAEVRRQRELEEQTKKTFEVLDKAIGELKTIPGSKFKSQEMTGCFSTRYKRYYAGPSSKMISTNCGILIIEGREVKLDLGHQLVTGTVDDFKDVLQSLVRLAVLDGYIPKVSSSTKKSPKPGR